MTYTPFVGETITAVHKTRTLTGTVVKTNPTRAVVLIEGQHWRIPYSLILAPGADVQQQIHKNVERMIERHTPLHHKGDKVRIKRTVRGQWSGRTGIIEKVNRTRYVLRVANNVPGHPGTEVSVAFSMVEAV